MLKISCYGINGAITITQVSDPDRLSPGPAEIQSSHAIMVNTD